jgi:hypothetical protein
MEQARRTLLSMAQGNRRSLSEGFRLLALALALAATGAWGMGDAPPEGREAPAAQQGACSDAKAGGKAGPSQAAGGGSCDATPAREPSNPDGKSRASRPDRYGTGYEARKGLGAGGGGGRGGRGR